MALHWIRLDLTFLNHDKIVGLKQKRGGHRAITAYVFGLLWAVQHETDGKIPTHVALTLEAHKPTQALLVDAGLWDVVEGGWLIRNFAERQQLSTVTHSKSRFSGVAGRKGNCVRWHGDDCGCWESPE